MEAAAEAEARAAEAAEAAAAAAAAEAEPEARAEAEADAAEASGAFADAQSSPAASTLALTSTPSWLVDAADALAKGRQTDEGEEVPRSGPVSAFTGRVSHPIAGDAPSVGREALARVIVEARAARRGLADADRRRRPLGRH